MIMASNGAKPVKAIPKVSTAMMMAESGSTTASRGSI